jgi:hypothetical protein
MLTLDARCTSLKTAVPRYTGMGSRAVTGGHGLSMDSNPFATCKERRKTAEAAKQAYTAAVIAAEDTASDEATMKEAECKRATDEANKLVEEAEAVANAMHEAVKGRDIKLEEQVGDIRPRLPLPFALSRAFVRAG